MEVNSYMSTGDVKVTVPNVACGVMCCFFETTISHINSETNPPPPIVNVVWKHLREFLGTSIGVATLPICCNIEYGKGA